MKAVIDFSGYIDSRGNFVIKEYSLVLLDRNGSERYTDFGIEKPEKYDLRNLDLKTKLSYHKYYETYGITWHTGTESREHIKSIITNLLRRCYTIFVADNEKKKFFRRYLKDVFTNTRVTAKVSIVSLKDFGFEMEPQNVINCHRHRGPSNICAKDGVSQMVKFVRHNKLYNTNQLKRCHLVVDFNTHQNNFQGVKELSFVYLDHNRSQTKSKTMVVKPSQSSVPLMTYKDYHDKYGIRFDTGNIQSETLRLHLSRILNRALFIYVKDNSHKKILYEVDKDCISKVICFDELGYNAAYELRGKKCKFHDIPRRNYCAERNVQLMADWLRKNFNNLSRNITRDRRSLNVANTIQPELPVAFPKTRKDFLELNFNSEPLDFYDLVNEINVDDPDAPTINHTLDSTVIEAADTLSDNNSNPIDIDSEFHSDVHDLDLLNPEPLFNDSVENLEDYDFDLDLSSDLFRGADVQANAYGKNDEYVGKLLSTRTFSDESSSESDTEEIKEFINTWIDTTDDEVFLDTYFVNSPSDSSLEMDFSDVDIDES